jgi:hypothetical protein
MQQRHAAGLSHALFLGGKISSTAEPLLSGKS